MKKNFKTIRDLFFAGIACMFLGTTIYAQAPQKMSYQAVVRDLNNDLSVNQSVGMQISILQGSPSGTEVYVETQTATTNDNGLVSLEIGSGTVVSGDFSAIDWSTGNYYIKTETDPNGGTDYTISGTAQLLSVPYAMYAENSGNGSNNDAWSLNGNTVSDSNFLGTNNKPLRFKVFGDTAGIISTQNTALGFNALEKNTSLYNTAFGSNSLKSNSTGNYNVAVGRRSQEKNISGVHNTAIGYSSNTNNINGSRNVAVGNYALQANKHGKYNTALGYYANVGSDSLVNATAIGANAIVEQNNSMVLGSISGKNGATENTHVGIGTTTPYYPLDVKGEARVDTLHVHGGAYLTGINPLLITPTIEVFATAVHPIGTFSGKAFLGMDANPWGKVYTKEIYGKEVDTIMSQEFLDIKSSASISYSSSASAEAAGLLIKNTYVSSDPTAIGLNVGFTTNSLYLNTIDGTQLGRFDGTSGTYTALSDERLKTNFHPMESTLSKIMQLKPLSYKFKSNPKGRTYIGFKAQEVEKIFPNLVYSPADNKDGNNSSNYTMNYSGFGVVAIKAIQEQQKQIDDLKKELKALKAMVKALQK